MGIVFCLAEVPWDSGWSGDRAVLGIWSGRWRVPEALQAMKINKRKGIPEQHQQCSQLIMHKCLICSSFSLFPQRQISLRVWQEASLWLCALYVDRELWIPSCGFQCLTKVLTPVKSKFKMLPHQIRGALYLSGTAVVEMNSAKGLWEF